MWDAGEHLLAAFIFAQLLATDEKHWVRWFVLTVAFVVLAFIKDYQAHGGF